MNIVYLGLGSNLGQRQQNIELALEALNQINDISLHSIATYYETMAVATVKQPNYLNSAAKISTFLTPIELLDITESIEVDLGRDTKGFGDPRIIDIDILFYNDDIISTDRLTIPHPLAHERLFVLDPLNEIAPDFVHPIFNATIQQLRNDLEGY